MMAWLLWMPVAVAIWVPWRLSAAEDPVGGAGISGPVLPWRQVILDLSLLMGLAWILQSRLTGSWTGAAAPFCLASHYLFLGSALLLLRAMGWSRVTSQGAIMGVGIALCTTAFWISPLIRGLDGASAAQQWLVSGAMFVNPIVMLANGACGVDLLRAHTLYTSSVLGEVYYSYPPWWHPCVSGLALAALVGGATRLVSRRNA